MAQLRLNAEIDFSALRALLARRSGIPRIAEWFRARLDLAVLTVVAVGFVFQIAATRDRSLSPDEALHFGLVNVHGPVQAYRNAWTNAHPPLFFLILYLWIFLGRSELFLRVLPAAFGAGFLWLFYRWAGRVFGKASGFLAVVMMALSPMWFPLSVELRHYSLLLLLSAAALLQFEKAMEERSRARLLLSSFFLYLAILTHYSALFITLSVAAYQAIRLRASGASRKLAMVWIGCQAGVAALYLFLYLTHVRGLRGSAMEEEAVTGWLNLGYFHRGRENPVWFLLRQTWGLFRYFGGSATLAAIALLLALAGVVAIAAKRSPAIVLLTLPYLLGATAGLVGVYPFTGTRHSAYLLPFVSAAIGVALATLLAKRIWLVLPVCAFLVLSVETAPAWATAPHSLSKMNAAMARLRERVPAGSILFTDNRTGRMLDYYLGRDERGSVRAGLNGFWENDSGHYCVVGTPLWTPEPDRFSEEVGRMVSVYRVPVRQSFWVIRVGNEFDLVSVLSRRFPVFVIPASATVGDVSFCAVWLEEQSATSRPHESFTASVAMR